MHIRGRIHEKTAQSAMSELFLVDAVSRGLLFHDNFIKSAAIIKVGFLGI